jgi:tetratricopeptide (TPR) repeat protein
MRKKTFLIGGIILIIIVSIGVFTSYFLKLKKMPDSSYAIPNVPYIGIYNHTGNYSYANGDTAAAVSSVLEYWNPGKNNLKEINNALTQTELGKRNSRDAIIDFINKNFSDYSAERKELSFEELKNYVSQDQRTPILISFSLSKNQPKQVNYYPYNVLVGIDYVQKKLIFHNYWFGNNYEISFNHFDFIQKNEKISCIVIQPKDLMTKIAEVSARESKNYPSRTPIMNESQGMIRDYIIGSQLLAVSDKLAGNYFIKAMNDPKFQDWMPPYFKMSIFHMTAEFYLKQNNLDKALLYANKAVEENHDLDKPFKDWPGFELRTGKIDIIDRSSEPYRVLGDVKKAVKDLKGAKEAYQKALEIRPNNLKAFNSLKEI